MFYQSLYADFFYSTQSKLEGRVSLREMTLEERKKGEQTQDNNETESDSETLLGEKTRKNKSRGDVGGSESRRKGKRVKLD